MANQDVRVSALNSTSTLSTDDLSLETVVDELSETGYTSKKITEGAKASQYLEAFTYANLNTTAKTIVGAINEAAESGGAGAFIIHWGASITESGPDIWAAYEGGEVLIIELGSASPFDYLSLTKVYITSSYINLSFNGINDGGAYVRAQIILNPSTKAIIDSSFLRGGVLGQIDDTTTASGKVWSSAKIAEELADKTEIADTVVSTASAWSSSRIVGLLPTDTASGSVANFPDGADNVPVKSLLVDIDYKDTTGFSVVNVTRTGVNIWDEKWELGSISTVDGSKVAADSTIRTKNNVYVKPNTKFSIVKGTGFPFYILFYDTNGDAIQYVQQTGDVAAYNLAAVIDANASSATFTTPSGTAYILIRFNSMTSYSGGISVNYPSTDTTYHAYVGESVEIALGGTIYGGSVDITSGTVTSTKAQDGTDLPDPIVTTIDPTMINTLKGVNNIWADTGDTAVEYRADIQLYIEKKIAEAVSNRSLSLMKSEALEEKSEEKEEVEK